MLRHRFPKPHKGPLPHPPVQHREHAHQWIFRLQASLYRALPVRFQRPLKIRHRKRPIRQGLLLHLGLQGGVFRLI